ncbi:NUDIX hydrolase [Glycomyces buryatensis]|uniref:NUDIX domain-containing protein n=1 Tax=Glycomyces buryatensis TaxID=2570927 RepID=A0A4V4HS62_9ACTN|nr:NUDIX domain-containing protein [Glycomyces buryatensis]THV40526.1 NUDIX domain-containing protein [Glycomyces buryatensis]
MATNPEGLIFRRAARVLIVDEDDRVLLFYGSGLIVQDGDYYFTVGGGVEDGESLAEAAAREVFEETGLRVTPDELGPLVAHLEGAWTTHTGTRFYSDDNFFFLRTKHFEPVFDGLEEGEEKEIDHAAWLTLEELAASETDYIFPIGLAGVLGRLLSGETLTSPIELEWINLWSDRNVQ